jgi:NAD(P)-dependent dehydrogenase (short-subunit alcohol dehydrogenase family)
MRQYASYPDLKDQCVVVTGGGSGIGAGMVNAFALQGARVFYVDIVDEHVHAAYDGHAPTFVRCDLTDIAALQAAFRRIESEAGKVDVLVNNAANDDRHDVDAVSANYWDDRLAVNLRHQFFCAQAVAPRMREQGRGVILNLGSISWHLALPKLSLYMTAKAGIEGLTRGLARDLGPDGIRVNCIVPGAVRTPRQMKLWHNPEEEKRILAGQCLPKRVEVEDVASLALFLASDSAALCTGRDYFVDAGWYGA